MMPRSVAGACRGEVTSSTTIGEEVVLKQRVKVCTLYLRIAVSPRERWGGPDHFAGTHVILDFSDHSPQAARNKLRGSSLTTIK